MRGDEKVMEKIKHQAPSDLSLSTITLAEIFFGIENSPVKKKKRRMKIDSICSQLEIYPFDEIAAHQYSIIRANLEKREMPISERDLQIGSIAKANSFILITNNTKEFNRIKELQIENWAS